MSSQVNIFDFDGTIAESNLLKTKAFKYCAIEFGDEIVNWFIRYHQDNGGVTRQVKIHTLCEKIERPDLAEYFLDRYEEYLSREWLGCPLIKGFREYIEHLNGTNLILSGGSKVEIEAFLKANELDCFFVEVFGNPIDKRVNLETITSKYLSDFDDVFFYGDSALDFELSKLVNSSFIFISSVSEWSEWHEYATDFYRNASDFTSLS